MPVHLEPTTGEAHGNWLVTELLSDLKPGAMLLADRGYDADWISFRAPRVVVVAIISHRRRSRSRPDVLHKLGKDTIFNRDPNCLFGTRQIAAVVGREPHWTRLSGRKRPRILRWIKR
jgi:hypothetical protein